MSNQSRASGGAPTEQDTRRARRVARQEELKLERARAARNGRLRAVGIGVAAGLLALGLTIFVLIPAFSGPTSGVAAQGRTVAIQGRDHIRVGQAHAAYNSVPATSGPHYDSPADWGVYNQALPEEQTVHNLEHGGIVIRYYCPTGCPELVTQLKALVGRYRSKVLLAPYDKPMDNRIALTAWGWIDSFDDFDEARIVAFINAHKNQGPEQFPD